MVRLTLLVTLLCFAAGCSTLGIELYPTGHFLTNQTKEVLNNSPSGRHLPRELNASVLPAHYLQPGDVVLIEPVDLTADLRIPADQTVLVDGTVDLAGYGRVVVAGLTIEAAEHLIEETIASLEEEPAEVNVQLLENVHRYYVLGEVASPGSYPLVGFETVLDGIVAAGGLTEDSAPCKILLSRPTPPPSCRVVLPICYREITQLGDTTTNYQLQPGDRIYVATRSCLDELFFWRANRTCDHCRGCQVPCRDPSVAMFRNPFASILPTFPFQSASELSETVPFGTSMDLSDQAETIEQSQNMTPNSQPVQPTVPRLSLPEPMAQPMLPSGDVGAGELEFESPIPAPGEPPVSRPSVSGPSGT